MSICIETLSKTCQAKRLSEADLPAAYTLCSENPLYYFHMNSAPSIESLRKDLTALPPGKGPQDKYFIGLYGSGGLLAIVDLIDGYPEPTTAFLGFFMVEHRVQGQGLGSRLIEELLSSLRAAGFSKVRLAFVKGNPQSEAFWKKNGFLPTSTEVSKEEGYTAVVMERLL